MQSNDSGGGYNNSKESDPATTTATTTTTTTTNNPFKNHHNATENPAPPSQHHPPTYNYTSQQQQQQREHQEQYQGSQTLTANNGGRQQDCGKSRSSLARFKQWMINWRGSRRLVLVIVAIALLLDNMLLTTVVPIIPEFLYDIRHPDAPLDSFPRTPLSTYAPPPPTPQPCLCPIDSTTDMTGIEITTEELNDTFIREAEERHKELVGETVEVGIMFASKAFVQLLANPIVGPLTHKIGYSIPMFAGFVIMFFSTIIFAFGRSYWVLFTARALQGIGSSCSSVSGMGMLADRYTDDKERGNAMGIALGGLALGVLIGPPFGGIMYEFVGKSAPFLILSALALGDGLLQLFMLQPSVVHTEQDPPSLKSLISDPYILIAAGAITFANMGIAMLEPSLPIWMMDNMGASRWEQGVTFLPASISYLIGTNLFGPLGHKIGRWLAALIGLVVIGICLIFIPMAKSINHLILPNAGLGFAIGMVDSCMMPELGYLVDIRHSAVYGSVYALGDVAFCLGFAVGPALSGTLVNSIGFEWMLVGIAILCFIYAPFLTFLKAPPTKEEKAVSTESGNNEDIKNQKIELECGINNAGFSVEDENKRVN